MPPFRAFVKGDRVEVEPRIGRRLASGRCKQKGGTIMKQSAMWINRRGTITDCNVYNAYVKWDGRATVEMMPVKSFRKLA
jgi:hypothetical protein